MQGAGLQITFVLSLKECMWAALINCHQLSTPRSRQDTDFSLEGALADLGGALPHGYIPRIPSGPATHTDTEEPQ